MKSLEELYVEERFRGYSIIGNKTGSSSAKLFILKKNNQTCLVKIACTKGIDNGNEKLKDEITFLENISSNLKESFVQILEKEISGETVWYTMPYYHDYSTIRELIMKQENCNGLFESIFKLLFEELYNRNKIETKPYFDPKDNFTRVENRLAETLRLNSHMKDLVHAEFIEVNGKTYENYHRVFNKLVKNYKQVLFAAITCPVHKDLSIENILVKHNNSDFKIIDPRGPGDINNYGDYVYDLAKFSYTLNGFTSIKYDNFTLVKIDTGSYEFNICEIDRLIYRPYCKDFYDLLNRHIPNIFVADSFWRYRLLFMEACHYLSNVPCFLYNGYGVNKAEALYLQGIILLNDFMSILSKEQWAQDAVSRYLL